MTAIPPQRDNLMALSSDSSGGEAKEGLRSGELGDVLEFMRLLWELHHQLAATSKRMEARLGITGPQRLAIRIIGRYPGIPAGGLAEILHLHPSTLTGILRRLERGGFVDRRADPADGRRALLGLTERGRALDGGRAGTIESAVHRALEQIPPRKVAAARDVLTAVVQSLAADA